MQPKWIESDKKGVQKWDSNLDGVTWFSDGTDLWFTVAIDKYKENKVTKGRIDDYEQLQGEKHKRSWDAWNRISIQPDPEWLLLNLKSYEKTEVSVPLETGGEDEPIALNANLGELVNKFGMVEILRAIPADRKKSGICSEPF
jgi:hypothetical protein